MSNSPDSVTRIIEQLGEIDTKDGEVRIGELVKTLGGRSYGPMLLVPALLGMTPIGGIPTVPSILGAMVAIIAVQILLGRSHFWLPGIIADRSVSADKLEAARAKLRKPAQMLDDVFHGRLEWATGSPFTRVAAVFVLCLAATVVPLELIPLAAAAPFAAIAAFGLAIMVRDGVLMLLAIAVSIASFVFAGSLALN